MAYTINTSSLYVKIYILQMRQEVSRETEQLLINRIGFRCV